MQVRRIERNIQHLDDQENIASVTQTLQSVRYGAKWQEVADPT